MFKWLFHILIFGSGKYQNKEKPLKRQRKLGLWVTVTSPNIARPLTLRTSPSDYATFNQIKSFLLFNFGLLLEREKQQKVFTFFHC